MNLPHTPGPWHVRLRNGPGHITAEVCYGSDGECVTDGIYEVADAHLIAAAPDLLAALLEIKDQAGLVWNDDVFESARAAIAKANGGAA